MSQTRILPPPSWLLQPYRVGKRAPCAAWNEVHFKIDIVHAVLLFIPILILYIVCSSWNPSINKSLGNLLKEEKYAPNSHKIWCTSLYFITIIATMRDEREKYNSKIKYGKRLINMFGWLAGERARTLAFSSINRESQDSTFVHDYAINGFTEQCQLICLRFFSVIFEVERRVNGNQ